MQYMFSHAESKFAMRFGSLGVRTATAAAKCDVGMVEQVGALLEKRLIEEGLLAYRLDGDNVRFGLNKDLGFSEDDRKENIRRIGEVCRCPFSGQHFSMIFT